MGIQGITESKHAAGIAPCTSAEGKVPGMSHKELAAQKA